MALPVIIQAIAMAAAAYGVVSGIANENYVGAAISAVTLGIGAAGAVSGEVAGNIAGVAGGADAAAQLAGGTEIADVIEVGGVSELGASAPAVTGDIGFLDSLSELGTGITDTLGITNPAAVAPVLPPPGLAPPPTPGSVTGSIPGAKSVAPMNKPLLGDAAKFNPANQPYTMTSDFTSPPGASAPVAPTVQGAINPAYSMPDPTQMGPPNSLSGKPWNNFSNTVKDATNGYIDLDGIKTTLGDIISWGKDNPEILNIGMKLYQANMEQRALEEKEKALLRKEAAKRKRMEFIPQHKAITGGPSRRPPTISAQGVLGNA